MFSSNQLLLQGPIHAVGVIAREEGLRGLWSGCAPTIMRNGTNQMCLFWAKNNFDRLLWGKLEGDGRQLTMVQSMGSGFSAACLGPFATGPFDVVKVSCLSKDTQVSWATGGHQLTGKMAGLISAHSWAASLFLAMLLGWLLVCKACSVRPHLTLEARGLQKASFITTLTGQ